MIHRLIDKINRSQVRKEAISAPVGSSVHVHVKIKEGDKERVQVFSGTVIGHKGTAALGSFTVRRVSHGVGVERVFPMNAPNVVKVEIEKGGRVRRAKLYYLRDLRGKRSRLKTEDAVPEAKEKAAAT